MKVVCTQLAPPIDAADAVALVVAPQQEKVLWVLHRAVGPRRGEMKPTFESSSKAFHYMLLSGVVSRSESKRGESGANLHRTS